MLPEATTRAPVSRIAVAFCRPNADAIAGCSTLYVPALPQHRCASGTSTNSSPGMDASNDRGSVRTPCAFAR